MTNPRGETSSGLVADRWWTAALSLDERGVGVTDEPDWAVFLRAALAAAPEVGSPVPDAPVVGDEREFAYPLSPLVDLARDRFVARLGSSSSAEVDQDAVWSHVRHWLVGRLVGIAGRVLVRELRAARAAGRLRGADGRARLLDHLRRSAGRAELTDLFQRYPVLARLLAQRCLWAADTAAELVSRFVNDRAAIVGELLAGQEPGVLVQVTPGEGDLHDGGRSVALLGFSSGARLVYKPRPLGLHVRWNELLAWFGNIRPNLAVRAVRVLARPGYGWAEFVPALPCQSSADVELFYRRQGALLALLYALDATDIHFENLIACADQPVVVDIETLFHPDWLPDTDSGHDPAFAALNRSVMRIALLPRMLLFENGGLDVSGLGAEGGGMLPTNDITWTDLGTDSMRLVRRPMPFVGGRNRPTLAGRSADPMAYQNSLVSGFRVGYETVVEHAVELLAEDGPLRNFGAEQVRLVMRNTQVYASLLDAATRPELLRDGAARQSAFGSLRETNGHPHLRALVSHEERALYVGDIPMFTARADSQDVHPGTGQPLPGLLSGSGIQAAAAKIRRMGATDLGSQEWLVRATMATRSSTWSHRVVDAMPGPVASVVPDQQHILAIASGIGDDLIARSYEDERCANWLGLELVDGRFWSVLPMGAGLGDGYCGVALFLAQVGRLTGIGRYLDLARTAIAPLPDLIGLLSGDPDLVAGAGCGAFRGLGGISYALARLATLLGDNSLVALLPDALRALVSADTPGRLNVADGTAGALAAVTAVAAETALPEATALQTVFTERLRGQSADLPPGFLWGSAGVDWALGLAGPDRVEPVAATGPETDLGWCAGTAGQVLAGWADRLPSFADQRVHDFAAGLAGLPLRADLSLCHGQLGRVEPLIELARRGYAPVEATLTRVAAQILGGLEQYEAGCGTPNAVSTPGLLAGLAGIGYGLLRLGFGQRVPSVLLLQPSDQFDSIGPN